MSFSKKAHLLFIFLFGLTSSFCFAQFDSLYLEKPSDQLIMRVYLSRKYTDFALKDPQTQLRFLPNSGKNLGIGATYKTLTLNLAFPVGFLNPNRRDDFPKYFDLQVHLYPQKWIIDLFGQFYNGYSIRDYFGSGLDYVRADMKMRKIGANVNYLFNGEQISLVASMQQSEIQKRSAISPMVGFEAYRITVQADSLIFPSEVGANSNFQRGDFIQIGPNAGMVGTLVLGQGFFVTAALSADLGLGYRRLERQTESRVWEFNPTYFARGFAGYNGQHFSINLNYVYKRLSLAGTTNFDQSVNTGNYRVNLVYKFPLKKEVAKFLSRISPSQIFGK
ncbi:DUF4421 domain-containing protein [Algoriphagus sp.]|uniref:DUF4421 domain-containing protein n=1 Tax=Algoriphagus sp. TaxID=1872435 RepID=UPI002613917D|nr:DUF4421 domain-containing protein [Algoriphagus sp.]